MSLTNAGSYMHVHEATRARAYVSITMKDRNTIFSRYWALFVNDTILCSGYLKPHYICDDNRGNLDDAKMLAGAFGSGGIRAGHYAESFRYMHWNSMLLVNLTKVTAHMGGKEAEELYTGSGAARLENFHRTFPKGQF